MMKTWTPGDPVQGEELPFLSAHEGSQLYVVRHTPSQPMPKAVVVLAGPMTLERSHGALTWVRLARCLCASGYEVFRFDYRGVGESTGVFAEQTFDSWRVDLERVAAMARQSRDCPVMLLGLRLGALLGGAVFEARQVDAFLAWDPPQSGKTMLMDMLRRKLAADYMEFSDAPKKSREDYVRLLEAGQTVEVEGYDWTRALWHSAVRLVFEAPARADAPWHVTYLDGRSAERLPNLQSFSSVPIPKPSFWLQSPHLIADLGRLFSETVDRLDVWSELLAPKVAARAS